MCLGLIILVYELNKIKFNIQQLSQLEGERDSYKNQVCELEKGKSAFEEQLRLASNEKQKIFEELEKIKQVF